jgi:hypothetical protein
MIEVIFFGLHIGGFFYIHLPKTDPNTLLLAQELYDSFFVNLGEWGSRIFSAKILISFVLYCGGFDCHKLEFFILSNISGHILLLILAHDQLRHTLI